jgi:hypothetical protein
VHWYHSVPVKRGHCPHAQIFPDIVGWYDWCRPYLSACWFLVPAPFYLLLWWDFLASEFLVSCGAAVLGCLCWLRYLVCLPWYTITIWYSDAGETNMGSLACLCVVLSGLGLCPPWCLELFWIISIVLVCDIESDTGKLDDTYLMLNVASLELERVIGPDKYLP